MDNPLTNPSIDLKGRRILAVDDDRINLKIIGGILRSEGYEITEAASGEQALELYPKIQPNLVLLDVMMPGIDGFTTCRTLKKTYGDACAPVIFITAKSEAEDVVMGFDAGGVTTWRSRFARRRSWPGYARTSATSSSSSSRSCSSTS
jgi:two-component system, sensor histidine kinase and response regulator